MGTWGEAILEADGPLDQLGDIRFGITERLQNLSAVEPTAEAGSQAGALLGLLLQLDGFWTFSPDNDEREQTLSALRLLRPAMTHLPEDALTIVDRVLSGDVSDFDTQPEPPSEEFATRIGRSICGKRVPGFFADEVAAAVVQGVAEICAERTDEGTTEFAEEVEDDLYELQEVCGLYAPLLVIAPYSLSVSRIEKWREPFRRGFAQQEEYGDEDLDFWRAWIQNVEWSFDYLIRNGGVAPVGSE